MKISLPFWIMLVVLIVILWSHLRNTTEANQAILKEMRHMKIERDSQKSERNRVEVFYLHAALDSLSNKIRQDSLRMEEIRTQLQTKIKANEKATQTLRNRLASVGELPEL